MEEWIRKVEKHEKDLYFGNHKPSITTRLLLVEETQENHDERIKSIEKRFWAILLCIVATFLTVLVDVVFKK